MLHLCLSLLVLFQSSTLRGTVRDPGGGVVPSAEVSVLTAGQSVVRVVRTNDRGDFEVAGIATGSYELVILAPGFAPTHRAVRVGSGVNHADLVLELNPLVQDVTVTAEFGRVEETGRTAQKVTIVDESEIAERATAVTAQVANDSVGVALQRTSSSIGGIYVRGLTGKNVVVYLDGVRYTTSAQRGGVNTFLNLSDPTDLRRVEVLRGPSSAQYGSDSLGGTVQLLSKPALLAAGGRQWSGGFQTLLSSADLGFGSSLQAGFSSQRAGFTTNLSGRRVNTMRPGKGVDTHSALTRFLGLPSTMAGRRLSDTAFSQYAGSFRLTALIGDATQFTVSYSRSQQDGGKRYDQLLGGDGNNIASLRNLMLDFFYARVERGSFGPFDTTAASFSFNAQREERVNQGGNGNPLGAIVSQYEKTRAFGIQWRGSRGIGTRYNLNAGVELYPERIDAPAATFDPRTGLAMPSRPRVPDAARYIGGGAFSQHSFEVVPGKFRAVGAFRYSAASYRAPASPLSPADSLRVGDVTANGGVVFSPVEPFSVHFNASRGYRAPSMTDVGTLGLTGDGFEVAPADVAGLGGMLGSTADGTARSLGIPVRPLRPEISYNYEAGFRAERGRVDFETTGFLLDLKDAIVKQALILPAGAAGRVSLGGQPVAEQTAGGAVFVPLSNVPVLVRTNLDRTRHYGIEVESEIRLREGWVFGGNGTWVRAYDRSSGLAPNVEGGTPAPRAHLRFQYRPASRSLVFEVASALVAPQSRFSTLDLADRRTGATRTRATIAGFFNGGAVVRGYVRNGVLLATGETLAQVQDRVLGPGVERAPLVRRLPGYVLLNARGTYRLNDAHELGVAMENITDRNYRGVNWGVPGPGFGLTVRYSVKW